MDKRRKPIEKSHLSVLEGYFRKKVAAGELPDLLDEPEAAAKVEHDLIRALDSGRVSELNRWVDLWLSASARKKMWVRIRNSRSRKKYPRSDLTQAVAQRLREASQLDDVNQAVTWLLDQIEGKGDSFKKQ